MNMEIAGHEWFEPDGKIIWFDLQQPRSTTFFVAGTNVQTAVTSYALYSMHSTASMSVNVTYVDSSSAPPNRVRVTVSYLYQPFFGLGWPSVTVNAASEGRIMF